MIAVTAVTASSDRDVDAAAAIWAAATAARDHEDEASIAAARPVIRTALGNTGILLLARRGGQVEGFAVLVPGSTPAEGLELRYLGVHPRSWGTSVGSRLLEDVEVRVLEQGCAFGELWVYDDNDRATALYRWHGWVPTSTTRTHPTSGRVERRHVLTSLDV